MISVIALLTTGIVIVTSAGLTIDPDRQVTVWSILSSRTTVYAGLAILALLIGTQIDTARWLQPSWAKGDTPQGLMRGRKPNAVKQIITHPAVWVLGASMILLALVHMPGIGVSKNGAARWIEISAAGRTFSMQPSEVMKWAVVFTLPALAVALGWDRMRRFWTGFLPMLGVLLLVCAIIVREDLGTAVLIGASGMVILLAAGARWWHAAILAPVPIAGIVAAIMTSDYRMRRVETYLDPYSDSQHEGYQMIQSMAAIANGDLTGRGLGHGVFKFGYLPEDTTDFLFAIICEELGVAGATLIMFLYATLLIAGLMILKRLTAPLARLMVLGVITTFGFQAIINLFVVTGLAPTKGIALPLLSAGGTGWILTAFSLGLIIGLDRAQEKREATTAVSQKAQLTESLTTPHTPLPVVSISAANA